jgi:hypothetical protein
MPRGCNLDGSQGRSAYVAQSGSWPTCHRGPAPRPHCAYARGPCSCAITLHGGTPSPLHSVIAQPTSRTKGGRTPPVPVPSASVRHSAARTSVPVRATSSGAPHTACRENNSGEHCCRGAAAPANPERRWWRSLPDLPVILPRANCGVHAASPRPPSAQSEGLFRRPRFSHNPVRPPRTTSVKTRAHPGPRQRRCLQRSGTSWQGQHTPPRSPWAC